MSSSHPAFSELVQRFHALRCRDPNTRLHLGLDWDLGTLPDPSLEQGEQECRDAQDLLTALETVDVTALDFDDQLDLELLRLMLGQQVHAESLRFNGRSTRQQLPQAADGLSDGIYTLFISDPREVAERVADITGRLEAAPAYLAAMEGRLEHPVGRWVQIELDKLAGLPALLGNIRRWAAEAGQVDTQRLDAACQQTLAAAQAYAANLRMQPVADSFHLDEADARSLVRLRGIDLSFEELQQLATGFLADTRQQIEQLRERLCRKYRLAQDVTAAELQIFLQRRFAVAKDEPLDEILQAYRREARKIEAFIRERDLFVLPDGQALKILQTPEFLAPTIPAGAMEPPPPFRPGVRTSLVYLTLSEELRDEHTALGIPGMMIHEGIPGHHLQLSYGAMHPSLVRRHVSANDHAEGWTTMLEDYMLDQGYMGELTDEARFVSKLDLSRIGARVAIDLFFMTGQRDCLDVGIACDIANPDPFKAAGALLHAVTGFVPGRVEGELNWYSIERGYPLSYLAGNSLVWRMKQDLATHRDDLPALERDRLFHKTYLEAGNMPLSLLRRVLVQRDLIAA